MAADDRRTPTLPYTLIVHSYSSVTLSVSAEQSGFEPGARVRLQATVTQSGLPLDGVAIWADVTAPNGGELSLVFTETSTAAFASSFETTAAGVYRFRVRARGSTRKGMLFTRERTVTVAVWRGGDREAETSANPGGSIGEVLREHDARWCALMTCALSEGGAVMPELEKRLRAAGLDVDHLRKCLHRYCQALSKHSGAGTGPARDDV